jgi:hypothetical protein
MLLKSPAKLRQHISSKSVTCSHILHLIEPHCHNYKRRLQSIRKRLIQDMAKNNSSKLIPSRVVKKSLDTVLSVLGMSLTNTIFEDMWSSGIVFSRNRSYSIDQIYNYFEQRLGKHAADLLTKQLRKELANL